MLTLFFLVFEFEDAATIFVVLKLIDLGKFLLPLFFMIDFKFKKAEDIEEPECFYILFERGSEGLGAPPGRFNVEKPVEVL